MKSEQSPAEPDPLADFKGAANWGHGGQYVFDPVTKTRQARSEVIAHLVIDGQAPATTNLKQKGK